MHSKIYIKTILYSPTNIIIIYYMYDVDDNQHLDIQNIFNCACDNANI